MKRSSCNSDAPGFALISVILFLALLMTISGAYFTLSLVENKTTRYSKNSTTGFYSAEAGLNLRAQEIRTLFVGYNLPDGEVPDAQSACEGLNQGEGDFACSEFEINNNTVQTYVSSATDVPVTIAIPPGELYQGLNAQEYRYTLRSQANNKYGDIAAILHLTFKARLVPLFQFVAFYNKDLEILPGQNMTLSGPVHTNGDLYLNTEASLSLKGQVSSAKSLYRGRKNSNVCNSKNVTALSPINPLAIIPNCNSRTEVTNVSAWKGMVRRDVPVVTVPEPEEFEPNTASSYFTLADLRLALVLDNNNVPVTTGKPTGLEVRTPANEVNAAQTALLNDAVQCPGSLTGGYAVGSTNTFYNNREGKFIRMLEVDLRGLLNCLHSTNWLGSSKRLDDDTQDGLVFHLQVDGPNKTSTSNPYGVRVRNGSSISSNIAGAPAPQGLTLITDQAFYVYGSYNSSNWKPAAFFTDSFNVLSGNWSDANSQNWNARVATDTTINAAIIAGTDTTGGVEGAAGQSRGAYNGGLENYPRLHERWGGRTLTYRGSFVSLGRPKRVSGSWVYGSPQYEAPTRNWDYELAFNDAANLPPMSPRFVYLRQELFERDYGE